MDFLIYIGAVLALLGIAGVGYCMTRAVKIRKEPDEEKAKAMLQSLIAWNLGSVSVAAMGLIMVIMGMVL